MLAISVAYLTRSILGNSSDTPILLAIVSENIYPSCMTEPQTPLQTEALYCDSLCPANKISPETGE